MVCIFPPERSFGVVDQPSVDIHFSIPFGGLDHIVKETVLRLTYLAMTTACEERHKPPLQEKALWHGLTLPSSPALRRAQDKHFFTQHIRHLDRHYRCQVDG